MSATSPLEHEAPSGPAIIARLERLEVWSLSYSFIAIIGLGFLFTFYDIFDINVSFIQTCAEIKPGCTPETALSSLPLPVVLNLAGYVVGTLLLSPMADRFGRRNMLLFTMLVTGLGSLYNALAPDYTQFVIARIITGVGARIDPLAGRPGPARGSRQRGERHGGRGRPARSAGAGPGRHPDGPDHL